MKRYDVIQFLIDKYQLHSYLEVGVQNGDTFFQIRIEDKIGIDPASPDLVDVLKLTSDEFFSKNYKKFDLIFVDADHHAEQAFLDLSNSLKAITPNGFVVAHDTLPHSLEYANPEWCGTVFRAIQQINQDLKVSLHTVDDDHGVSILTLEPSPPGPYYKDFFDFFDNRVACLNLIPPEKLETTKFYGR